MGRFSSKFVPKTMLGTAKKLFFKVPTVHETESEIFEREFISYRIQSDNTLVEEVMQLPMTHPMKQDELREREKRKREWEGVRQELLSRKQEGGKGKEKVVDEGKGGKSIKLFGKEIQVDKEGVTVERPKVTQVHTLGELMMKEGFKVCDGEKGKEKEVFEGLEDLCSLGELMNQERGIAMRAKQAKAVEQQRHITAVEQPRQIASVEQSRQYTAVTRDSLSLSVTVMEGQGDNFNGERRSPSKSYTRLFKQYMRCCSPVRVTGTNVDSPHSQQAMIAVESLQTSGTFSFVSPLDDTPYDPVEEWWPRTAVPSLQYSVTSIDPFMERHPVWLERYGESSAAGEARGVFEESLCEEEILEGRKNNEGSRNSCGNMSS